MSIARLVVIAATLSATSAVAQSIQYRSPAGVEYRSQPDTGPVARAEVALAADPRNVDKYIALGVAQSGARQFREAIETFTRGLAVAPNHPMLLRWRGHRYLSTRQMDLALDDLTRGNRIDTANYGIWYHLGIVHFARRVRRRRRLLHPCAAEGAGRRRARRIDGLAVDVIDACRAGVRRPRHAGEAS
jgi:tetratricopeptide (TPR) repeat protein